MSELQIIESALEGAARRRRSERALRGLWHGLLIGTVISLLMAGAYHLLPLPLWLPIAAALVPFPCLAAGLIIGGLHKPPFAHDSRLVVGVRPPPWPPPPTSYHSSLPPPPNCAQ